MTLDEFIQSAVEGDQLPPGLNNTQTTLWQARAGQWDNAHDSCQNLPDPDGAWIHAWLHRQEGDLGNASYWYHRAGKTMPSTTLEEEWEHITRSLFES